MLFNSLDFAIFLPLVFLGYWFVFRRRRSQNVFLLVASYVFYGWWDPRFLGLIVLSSLVDYIVGLRLHATGSARIRRGLLWTSIIANLGILGTFKYFNFFAGNLEGLFSLFGRPLALTHLDIVLPVGISFYTFQTMSYTIDVYRRQLEPAKDIVEFFAYVSFFPQLVAGPIERAINLLPQFQRDRSFDRAKAVDGLRQILWGLFKKVVIADNAATLADPIFDHYELHGGSTLLFAAVLFSFQIYCDFSGYSDIALGTARLFGFDLMQNFAFPYFSRDIAEFWRRWHISLSTWFRDYLYIPLGGSRGGLALSIRNTLIVFLVSGFWHGANWTFVAWGALHALFFLPLLISGRNRRHVAAPVGNSGLPSARELVGMLFTFGCVVIAWVFFRSANVEEAIDLLVRMCSPSLFSVPDQFSKQYITLLIFFLVVEWSGRHGSYGLQHIGARWRSWARWTLYYGVLFLIFRFTGQGHEFIYFQF
ncbi:MAG: MBOAT family protein [Flavobacteriales bacterium]|nr:MBOAT family protein [Flavobacteriales bacterium]